MFPPTPDPTGDPERWTREEMRRWLAAVSVSLRDARVVFLVRVAGLLSPGRWWGEQRNLHPQDKDTREQLLERIRANLRAPKRDVV